MVSLAFVCNGPTLTIYVDGKVEATLDLPNKPLSLDRNNFGICGGGSYLVADVMMSELRFGRQQFHSHKSKIICIR